MRRQPKCDRAKPVANKATKCFAIPFKWNHPTYTYRQFHGTEASFAHFHFLATSSTLNPLPPKKKKNAVVHRTGPTGAKLHQLTCEFRPNKSRGAHWLGRHFMHWFIDDLACYLLLSCHGWEWIFRILKSYLQRSLTLSQWILEWDCLSCISNRLLPLDTQHN